MNALAFELPEALEAREPPEARGLPRDGVRLLVAAGEDQSLAHRTFSDLPALLSPGDLLVVNISATLPAALNGRRADHSRVRVHVATRAPRLGTAWRAVELRSPDGANPVRAHAGERIDLDGGASLDLRAPYASGARLMLGRFENCGPVDRYLAAHGEPIRYGYVTRKWPLEAYQNVYATRPGSAEMPSAGRPFTSELIMRIVAQGIPVAPITLHCGVSSPERHEPPFPEQFEVPEATARLVEATKRWGGRVIAVGTTVVRSLETTGGRAGSGWTQFVVSPEHPPKIIDGLITGWHEPEASHLQMLETFAGHELIARSYQAALEHGYLWHEYGDSHLILPSAHQLYPEVV